MLYVYGVNGANSRITRVIVPSPMISLAALNPFVAVLPAGQMSWNLGAVSIPVWVGTAAAAVLLLRLLVTAAAYRLGAHGGESGPSLRRQTLLLAGLGMFLIVYGMLKAGSVSIGESWTTIDIAVHAEVTAFTLLVAFLFAVPFLAGLSVPVADEDAPPGTAEHGAATEDVPYRLSRAFRPEHAGALPYFHLLTLVLTAAALLAFRVVTGVLPFTAPENVPASVVALTLCAAFHISGLGFCFWAISRFAAGLMHGVTQARALAFGIFAMLCTLPILVLSLTAYGHLWSNEPAAMLWLLSPFLNIGESRGPVYIWMLISGLQAFAWGFAFILGRMRWYRPAVVAAA
jgi:hypothetical protein